MVKKILLGTLVGFIVGSVVSGAIYMGLFGEMGEQWMKDYADCLKEMNYTGWVLGSLVYSIFIAILLHKFDNNDFKSGAFSGAWVSLLMASWYGIWNASTFTAYTWEWLPFDVIGYIVTTALVGGIVGWLYGKLK